MNTQSEATNEDALLRIFQRLSSKAESVSFYSGLASDWQGLLAFNPVATLTISDVSDLHELEIFFKTHQDNLLTGFVSYDLGRQLHGIDSQHKNSDVLPLLTFHAYENYLLAKGDEIMPYGENNFWSDYLNEQVDADISRSSSVKINLTGTISESNYRQGFEKIQRYILEGDIYQINYTFQLSAQTDASSRELFAYYLEHKPVAYAAYIETKDIEIASLSPEGFYHEKAGIITTRPIKGTRPRGQDESEDLALKEQLMASKKEQAELFMIIDLLRNDLGKVCEIGSVEVKHAKEVTALPNVWHTYGEIQGRRRENISPIEALLSMLPGGSITGCPKIRAMEIIDELEHQQRGIYTGSLGYRLPDGEMGFNIAIRTIVKQAGKVSLGVGGGITIKSDCSDEYQEALAKSHFFKNA